MFVGHYAVALAAKKLAPRTSLGWTFVAVQLLDIVWAPLILFGVEHARVIPGYLPASPLKLYDFPWTHSLLAAIAWSWLLFRISKNAILGACVFSHWVLDYVTHTADLPLYRGGPMVGLGLWRFQHATFLAETLLLLIGLLIYLQATRPRTKAGNYAVSLYVIVLIMLGALNLYGPLIYPIRLVAILAEVSYVVFAGVAYLVDRTRQPLPPEPQIRLNLTEA